MMAAEDPCWREWMRAAQQGDRERYAALLRAVIAPLRQAARSRWPRAGAAELDDIVQETLLALHVSLRLYQPSRPLTPFLLGILRFRGAEVMRRHHRAAARETAIDEVPETSEALMTNPRWGEAFDVAVLRRAITRLPESQRRAIEMTKLAELSLAEASAASGMSVPALKVATHRGVRALRKLMTGTR